MTGIKKNPATVGAVNRGIIQNQVPIYTPFQSIAQAQLFRRCQISPPYALLIVEFLKMGGCND